MNSTVKSASKAKSVKTAKPVKVAKPAPKAKSAKSAPAVKQQVDIALVVDCSGSMQALKEATVKALNRQIKEIKEQAYKTGIETLVSLYFFGDDVRLQYYRVNVKNVQDIRVSDFLDLGMTALYDATAHALHGQPSNFQDGQTFVVMVITDGHENHSCSWSANSLKGLIHGREKTDRWTITFLVPPGTKSSLVSKLGLSSGNVAEWEQTVVGTEVAGDKSVKAIAGYYATRAAGQTCSKNMFEAEVTASPAKVAKKLVKMNNRVEILTVRASGDKMQIRDFVNCHPTTIPGGFTLGRAYYQLSKPETVQQTKNVLIRNRKTGAIYGGLLSEMRKTIGLPEDAKTSIRVKPGFSDKWDIFIQSTSVNRKVVAGTDVLVVK